MALSRAVGGDDIQIRAGIYGTGVETFTVNLNGSPGAPIRVMPFPGEAFAINCKNLDLQGNYTWLWNDTLCNAEVYRSTPTATLGTLNDGTDLVSMSSGGDGNKIINWTIHDAAGVGLAPQSETADHEATGNILWNNGRSPFLAPTYGHGIYPHGTTVTGDTRRIIGNLGFNQVGYWIHAFADTGNLKNFLIQDNIGLTNGLGNGFDMLVGGQTALTNATVVNNVTLRTDGNPTATIGLMEENDAGPSASGGVVTGNYFAGTVALGNWDNGTLQFKNNTCVRAADQCLKLLFAGATPTFGGFAFSSNQYAQLGSPFGEFSVEINGNTPSSTETNYDTIAQWRTASGLDATSSFTAAKDLGTQVFIKPNPYVQGRGHVGIDNPSLAASIAVDLSGIVQAAQQFAVYSCYDLPTATNPGATPVLTGTYTTGTVQIPMAGTGKTPKTMPGGGFTPVNALPALGAFLVVQTSAVQQPPPPVTPPDTTPPAQTPPTPPSVPALPSTPAMPGLFDRTPVTTTSGEGWTADLDHRLQAVIAELQAIIQGNPGVAVDHLTVSPTSLTLTINTTPTTVPVDHITVSPSAVTLTPPTQVQIGTQITHLNFGRTMFGKTPGATDMQWAYGSPLFRFGFNMSGNLAGVKALNPKAICVPYALHQFCEATGQEPTDGNTSAWGTAAATWAQSNAQNVEDLFLHAAVGQQNNVARLASISATGVIALGIDTTNNRQQLTQSRAGVAASNAFQPDSTTTYTVTGATVVGGTTPVPDFTVTVSSIVSQVMMQSSYTGAVLTGGTIFRPGDGTKTLANRVFFEDETDWCWGANPGSVAGQAFQVFRIGQCMGTQSNGVFFDVHGAATMHWQSLEYGLATNGAVIQPYINDLSTLFGLYRSTYPGTIYFPNTANRITALEAQMADAAGGCQMESALLLFQPGTPNTDIGRYALARLAAGTTVVLGSAPAFNSAEPHAGATGLSTAFRAGGGHNYSTPDDRAMMTVYAAALIMVDQRSPSEIAAGALKKLYLDPANQFWDTFPISGRWETGFEFPLGEPTVAFPPLMLFQSGPDARGTTASVYARAFTDTGSETGTPTALVFLRVQGSNTTTYDATTAFTGGPSNTIPIAPPVGKTWGILTDPGTITGNLNQFDPVPPLWNVDAVILVPH